jgi:hypothetical protein
MASSRRQHPPERPRSSNSPPLKVSLSDIRLSRRASQYSTLTSYQQLRKASHTGARRASQVNREATLDKPRPRRAPPLQKCLRKRSRR